MISADNEMKLVVCNLCDQLKPCYVTGDKEYAVCLECLSKDSKET
ncbi:MAG: hypothetical protein K0R55_2519 [Sporomusa sp.]|nr:hypothetical protein [Sporomusa sp.]